MSFTTTGRAPSAWRGRAVSSGSDRRDRATERRRLEEDDGGREVARRRGGAPHGGGPRDHRRSRQDDRRGNTHAPAVDGYATRDEREALAGERQLHQGGDPGASQEECGGGRRHRARTE